MTTRNLFQVLMDTIFTVLFLYILRPVFPENFFDLENTYFFIIFSSILNIILINVLRKRKITTAQSYAPTWWSFPVGLGAGGGIFILMIIPNTSVIHIPILALLSLVATIITHHFAKKLLAS